MLPDWPEGTVLVLSTAGEEPHAIPVSAALRAGPERVLVALAHGRESLRRLRADPRVTLTILATGVSLTAHGLAHVISEELSDGVAAVEIAVQRIQNHGRPAFVIDAGVSWRWTDVAAGSRDAEVRAALARMAGAAPQA